MSNKEQIRDIEETAVPIGVKLSCQPTKSVSRPTSPTGVLTPVCLIEDSQLKLTEDLSQTNTYQLILQSSLRGLAL